MKVYILSVFPDMLNCVLNYAMIKRAQDKGKLEIESVDLRNFTHDKHRTTDDYTFGGGAGMLMKPEPVYEAMDYVKNSDNDVWTVLLTPQGGLFEQQKAKELSVKKNIALICGRYEGFDERIRKLADEEISIGNFVLSGGEIAAMCILDAAARLLPGVLGNKDSLREETFNNGIVEYPQYTRPAVFRDMKVPEILLSGNHQEIAKWRSEKSKEKTLRKLGEKNGQD